MKKSEIDRIDKEMETREKLPREVKRGLIRTIYMNVLLGIAMATYILFFVIENRFTGDNANLLLTYKICNCVVLILSIILVEVAYKKDDGYIAINGLEVMALAFVMLFTLVSKTKLPGKYTIVVIGVYFAVKAIVIYNIEKKKLSKGNSDIKELIDKKDKDLIKEDREKREKEKKVQKAEKKETKKRKQPTKKEIGKEKKEEEVNKETKKETDEKKVKKETVVEEKREGTTEQSKKTEKKKTTKKAESTTKKNGAKTNREKKDNEVNKGKTISETKNKKTSGKKEDNKQEGGQENKKVVEQKNEQTVPKKRGRPRKENIAK